MQTTKTTVYNYDPDEVLLSRSELRAILPPRALLPDLEPADTAPAPEDTEDLHGPADGTVCDTFASKVTVYVLNLIVLIFAFPVGLGLLVFNAMGGENLRTTAHALALTGLFLALGTTEHGARLLSAI